MLRRLNPTRAPGGQTADGRSGLSVQWGAVTVKLAPATFHGQRSLGIDRLEFWTINHQGSTGSLHTIGFHYATGARRQIADFDLADFIAREGGHSLPRNAFIDDPIIRTEIVIIHDFRVFIDSVHLGRRQSVVVRMPIIKVTIRYKGKG